YAKAVAAGVASTGLAGVDLGGCPPPLMYFSLFHWDLDGGIQITGSPNPAEHNGFKIFMGQETLHGDQIPAPRPWLEGGRYRSGTGRIEPRPVVAPYQDYVVDSVGRLPRDLHVVVDAGNATAGPVAPPIYQRMGARVTELFCTMDG